MRLRLHLPSPVLSASSDDGVPRRRRTARRAGPVAGLALCLAAAGAASAGPASAGTGVVSVTGTIQHVVVDGGPAGAGDVHGGMVLDTQVKVGGSLYDLPEDEPAPGPVTAATPAVDDLQTGDRVVVTLRAARDLSATEALEEAADGSATGAQVVAVVPAPPTAPATAAALTSVLGEHTLTVLPVQVGSGAAPPSRAALTTVATAASQYWSEQSQNRVTFTPTVLDTRRIDDPGSCDTTAIMRLALEAHGVPAANGNRHVAVYFPARADCGGWAGLGAIRGGDIWINGVNTVDVMAHEIGHNLGIGHANTATCREGGIRVSLSADCVENPYADLADVMGFATEKVTGNLNTALADQLGLVHAHEVTELPVTLDLARLADVGQVRSVKIPTPHGTVYVDFRPAQGRDVRKAAWAGVQVHRLVGGPYPESQLLDLQPATTTPFTTPALPTGASWDIPGTDRSLTVTATGDTHATLALAPTGGTSTTAATPASDLTFVPITPTRLLDTRGTAAPLGAGVVRDIVVAGRDGIPTDARAVALNLTAVGATSRTHLRAWPTGQARPHSSVLNTDSSRVVATAVMIGVGDARSVRVYNDTGQVHLVADVTGYYVPTGGVGFEALPAPRRVLDTRVVDGKDAPPVPTGGSRTVQLAGRFDVPPDASAVVVNVTSVDPASAGYLVAYPAGSTRPLASTVNHLPGAAATNRAAVRLGGGALTISLQGGAGHVLVDLVGWYGPTGRGLFTPVTPTRAFDTRLTTALGPGTARTFDVHTVVPDRARTVVMTLTGTNATAPATYLTAWGGGASRPGTSDLNLRPTYDQSNLLVVPRSGAGYGSIAVYNDRGTTDILGDVYGYFS